MKKILVIVLLVLSLVGCVETIGEDNYFVVTKVEMNCDNIYRYVVTIKTTDLGETWNNYKIVTNEKYHVGDTLKISLYKEEFEKFKTE